MAETPTEQLIKQVAKINEERELDRKRRHDLNDRLGVTLLSMDADIKRHEEGMQGVERLGQIVVALDHIVRGVDGKNGLRGDLKTLEGIVAKQAETMNSYKVQVAGLAAGFAIVGTFLGTILFKWIS